MGGARLCKENSGSSIVDGEAPAGGGKGFDSRVVAPGGWLSVRDGEFGRLGRC
jgi:hypothetical protein